jgi:hypothetical protein
MSLCEAVRTFKIRTDKNYGNLTARALESEIPVKNFPNGVLPHDLEFPIKRIFSRNTVSPKVIEIYLK